MEDTIVPKKRGKKKRYITSIISDIDNLNIDIPENIKLEAERQSINNVHLRSVRKKKKKHNIANSLYMAHENLGSIKDPAILGKILGLAKGEMSKAINSSDDECIIFHFPQEYIPEYIKYLNGIDVDVMTKNIITFTDSLCSMDSTILHEQPQNLAAAIIVFYTDCHGYTIENKNIFYKNIEKSSGTITRIYRIISQIYNK
jgi:hypothetical protein